MYKTASDFNLAVIGVYSKLQGQIGFFNELNEYRSDNLNIDAPTAGTQDRYDIDQFQDKASNGILESAW
ncbi:RagB/SusD family nutrient uptake outer membrane protein, partial [Pseudoxanthomonas sp. SGD-10]